MEVRLAETFLKVAELGNITRSAELLGYSQAAVTAQIKQLESDLGLRLFDRIGRGIQLTEAGRRFMPVAAALLRASQEADAFGENEREPAGHISMLAGSSLTMALLPHLVIRFTRQYPRVSIDIQTMDDKEGMTEALRQNAHDFMFDIGLRKDYHGCVKAAERREEFVFVCHSSDPLASKKNVTLTEMFGDPENYPFIFHGGDEADFSVKGMLAQRGMPFTSNIEFSASTAIVNLLLEGHGRSMVPRFIVERELARGSLAVIHTREQFGEIWTQLYYNAHKWVNPAMAALIGFMQREIGPVSSEE